MFLICKPRIWEGSLKSLLTKAENGDQIIISVGEWHDWTSHEEGVLIRKEGKYLLNGVDLLFEETKDCPATGPFDCSLWKHEYDKSRGRYYQDHPYGTLYLNDNASGFVLIVKK